MDETAPLLHGRTEDHVAQSTADVSSIAAGVVKFQPDGDPENPVDWPSSYKWGIVSLLAFMGFTV